MNKRFTEEFSETTEQKINSSALRHTFIHAKRIHTINKTKNQQQNGAEYSTV